MGFSIRALSSQETKTAEGAKDAEVFLDGPTSATSAATAVFILLSEATARGAAKRAHEIVEFLD